MLTLFVGYFLPSVIAPPSPGSVNPCVYPQVLTQKIQYQSELCEFSHLYPLCVVGLTD